MPYVYAFEEGSKEQKFLLGGKGANLAEMTNLGLPVPPGFTITTEACKAYMAAGDAIPDGLMDEVAAALAALEAKMGKRLGDAADPLLVSVRSGAAFSMPGMMDTVLNLGLNDVSVGGLAKQTDNERFAYDSYRRFVQMFGKIVLDIDGDKFEHALERAPRGARASPPTPSSRPTTCRGSSSGSRRSCWPRRASSSRRTPRTSCGSPSRRCSARGTASARCIYRRMEKIPDDLGTAVNVQTMVFGNKGDDSGTGVAFTRNPATGENAPVRRLPRRTRRAKTSSPASAPPSRSTTMGNEFPECHAAAARADADAAAALPRHVRHRVHHRAGPAVHAADARRQAHGRGRAAHGRRDGGGGPHRQARGGAARAARAARPAAAPAVRSQGRSTTAITKGLNASPGAAVGEVYFTADDAEAPPRAGEARDPRAARDVARRPPRHDRGRGHPHVARRAREPRRGRRPRHGHARGVRRQRARTSTSTVARFDGQRRDRAPGRRHLDQRHHRRGRDRRGAGRHARPERSVRDHPRVGRRASGAAGCAPTPTCPTTRRWRVEFGAEGIGLCRTEHMFLGDRLPIVQRFILADDRPRRTPRSRSSSKLQRSDFEGIFEAMDGLPVTIRLLDPPLHEFLPDIEELLVAATRKGELDDEGRSAARAPRSSGGRPTRCSARVGAGSASSSPASTACRRKAIIEAAVARKQAGGDPHRRDHDPAHRHRARARAARPTGCARSRPRCWPRPASTRRLPRRHDDRDAARRARRRRDRRGGRVLLVRHQRPHADDVRVLARRRRGPLHARVPRAQAAAGRTRSRPSTGGRRPARAHRRSSGAGRPVPTSSSASAASTVATPRRCEFCDEVGLDYVSCSPYRVPIARLAAAHAALGHDGPGSTA